MTPFYYVSVIDSGKYPITIKNNPVSRTIAPALVFLATSFWEWGCFSVRKVLGMGLLFLEIDAVKVVLFKNYLYMRINFNIGFSITLEHYILLCIT